MNRTYVALDLELTGLDYRRDEITEIALVRFQGERILETFDSLVYTTRPIPLKVTQLGGIKGSDVAHAPTFDTLRGRILGFIGSHPLVGHTIETDLHFLRKQGLPLPNPSIDTFELASILVPEARIYSLSHLAHHLGIPIENEHRALPDALATQRLFLALVERLKDWDPALLQELVDLARLSNWDLLPLFQDILAERRQIKPLDGASGHPLETKATAAKRVAPLQPAKQIRPIAIDRVAALVEPGGLFAQKFAGYEYRPQQVAMLRAVAEALNTPCHLLIEAGTGVGKSLAYLLPAIFFATQNGQRIVISSNTINLQDQLFTKDIPDIQRILPQHFEAALLKGRGNYLCLRRLDAFRRSRQLSPEEARVVAKVLAWLPQTETGDRVELLLINSENAVWSRIQATPETCLGERCRYRRSGRCFFYRAREKAERAHLVVVNHALLLSDMLLEHRVLPEYRYAIIDEAHHLEEQATGQFGLAVNRRELVALLSSLSRPEGEALGAHLGNILQFVFHQDLPQRTQQATSELVAQTATFVDTAQQQVYRLFDRLSGFLQNYTNGQTGYDQRIRLTSGLRAQPEWSEIETSWQDMESAISPLLKNLLKLTSLLEKSGTSENAERDDLLQELRAYMEQLNEMWEGLSQIIVDPQSNGIYWASLATKTNEITLHSAPLHVGPLLSDKLFSEKDAVILTSATLRTERGFEYIKERLGIEDPMEVALDSPFDYESAVLLYVPKDIPEPNQPGYQEHVEKAIIDLCRATEGRALILFTSTSQLRNTYRKVQKELAREGIVVFGQGIDGSRRQILRSFRETPKSVLMGTRSFWEGIDVMGQALSCLVIARLPFSVPTDPVLQARSETFENPFREYYLPETILKFRQGFGRLIRSKDDYGVVVVLDKRLITKSYGKLILRALPPCTARQGPLASLPTLARKWLDPRNRR